MKWLITPKDIKNYFFAKDILSHIQKEPHIRKIYDPKITNLGVMYFIMKVPNDVPDNYAYEFVYANLAKLDNILVISNLDGVVEINVEYIGSDENDKQFMVKVVPSLINRSLIWMIFSITTSMFVYSSSFLILYYLIAYLLENFR